MFPESDTASSKSCSTPNDSEQGIFKYIDAFFDRITGHHPVSSCSDTTSGSGDASNVVATASGSDAGTSSNDSAMSTPKSSGSITDRGPIKSMRLPDGWSASDSSGGGVGQSSNEKFSPGDGSGVTLSVYYRGLPLSSQGADSFRQILDSKPADGRPEVLTPKEIRNLKDVMGPMTVGNNQYTNDGSTAPPNFHIRVAATTKINGRTVLEVDGDFVDSNGNPVNDFRGIYADTKGDGKMVEQIMLQGKSDRISKYLKSYKEAIQSIQWE